MARKQASNMGGWNTSFDMEYFTLGFGIKLKKPICLWVALGFFAIGYSQW